MAHILIGSLLLSIVHALIPNHWIPLVAVSRSERWSRAETVWVTAVTGSAHTLSTSLLGIIIGVVGYRLSASYQVIMRFVAPLVLVAIGLVYVVGQVRHSRHHHYPSVTGNPKRTKSAIISSLAFAMFFSPCMEVEGYFFAAGAYGMVGIATVAVVYSVVTISGMVLFVDLARRGIQRIQSSFLEHNEQYVTGAVLIALGVAAYLVEAG